MGTAEVNPIGLKRHSVRLACCTFSLEYRAPEGASCFPECPPTQTPLGLRRPKPKAPQVIASEVWLAMEKAVCAGMGYSQAARTFGIRSPNAIIMRSRRDKWPVPSRVEERARQLQDSLQRRSMAAEQRRDVNEITTETLAQSWAEKGEAHRAIAFNLAHDSLKRSRQEGPADRELARR